MILLPIVRQKTRPTSLSTSSSPFWGFPRTILSGNYLSGAARSFPTLFASFPVLVKSPLIPIFHPNGGGGGGGVDHVNYTVATE